MTMPPPALRPCTLRVRELAWRVTEADLRALFEPFGPLHRALICVDPHTGASRGFGFVEFTRQAAVDLDHVIAAMDGRPLHGRPIQVERARDRREADA